MADIDTDQTRRVARGWQEQDIAEATRVTVGLAYLVDDLRAELREMTEQRDQLGHEASIQGGRVDTLTEQRGILLRDLAELRSRLAAVQSLCVAPVDGEARSHVPTSDVLAAARGEVAEPC